MLQIDPSIISAFVEFDDLDWQFIMTYPGLLSVKMSTARNKVIKALTTYFKQNVGRRNGASGLVLALESEMREQGLENMDIVALQMLTFWA